MSMSYIMLLQGIRAHVSHDCTLCYTLCYLRCTLVIELGNGKHVGFEKSEMQNCTAVGSYGTMWCVLDKPGDAVGGMTKFSRVDLFRMDERERLVTSKIGKLDNVVL